MGFADLDAKAGSKSNGAANGAALTLSADMEAKLAKMPKDKAARLRAKLLDAKRKELEVKEAMDAPKPSAASEPKKDPTSKAAASATEPVEVHAGDHAVTLNVSAAAPVIVQPQREPTPWREVVNNIVHSALMCVFGAAAWALFGTIIKAKLGV